MAAAVARRRRQLQRGHGYQRVHLTLAHLGVPLIEAIAVAREDGGGHGGTRPRVGRLRRGSYGSTLMAFPMSFSDLGRTQSDGEKGGYESRGSGRMQARLDGDNGSRGGGASSARST
jgi:hypothetical protein